MGNNTQTTQPPSNKRPFLATLILSGFLVFAGVLLLIGSLYGGKHQQLVSSEPTQASPTAGSPQPSVVLPSGVNQSAPDLSSLVALWTSDDPATQELGLAPEVRVSPGEKPGFLPPGTKVEVKPETWRVIKVHENNEPYIAWIDAEVTRPGDKEPQKYVIHLVNYGGQWPLFNSQEQE